MDSFVWLKIKTRMCTVALLLLTAVYLVVWSAWLWPTFPYPGVAWGGEEFINFRQWFFVSIIYGVICSVASSFRRKWIDESVREKAVKDKAAGVAEREPKKEEKEKNPLKKIIQDWAREAAAEEMKEGK